MKAKCLFKLNIINKYSKIPTYLKKCKSNTYNLLFIVEDSTNKEADELAILSHLLKEVTNVLRIS